jgi:hypothetical protein
MARGQESKLRRRMNRKKGDDEASRADPFGDGSQQTLETIPLPPSLQQQFQVETVDSDDEDDDDDSNGKVKAEPSKNSGTVVAEEIPSLLPQKRKTKKVLNNSNGANRGIPVAPTTKKEGIKMIPLIFLIMMTGTTLLPLVLYAGDMIGNLMAKKGKGSSPSYPSLLSNVGYQLNLGSIPRQRVLSFYEKHDPNKLADVPTILRKHYGNYPTLIKKLERKYQDYGYFLNWEDDEGSLLSIKGIRSTSQETYETVWLAQYWNVYAPQSVRNAARNAKFNLTKLMKQGRKLWRKQIWPLLERKWGKFCMFSSSQPY